MVNYDFYRNVYGGLASEADFVRASSSAETVLRRLLFPNVPEDFDAAKTDAFSRAVCVQADERMNAVDGPRVKSESLGDRSVTYADEDGRTSVGGKTVAAEAVLILENAGCISRWL